MFDYNCALCCVDFLGGFYYYCALCCVVFWGFSNLNFWEVGVEGSLLILSIRSTIFLLHILISSLERTNLLLLRLSLYILRDWVGDLKKKMLKKYSIQRIIHFLSFVEEPLLCFWDPPVSLFPCGILSISMFSTWLSSLKDRWSVELDKSFQKCVLLLVFFWENIAGTLKVVVFSSLLFTNNSKSFCH